MARSNLMSLPDEPLTIIFSYLGAFKTDESFGKPCHAFSLAQANTRLLQIFSSRLNRITPDLSNPLPPTLSRKHLVAVARLAGPTLRALYLPAGSFALLSSLADACPRLEVLSLVEGNGIGTGDLSKVLRLPLRALSIDQPSCRSLRSLIPPPPELTLTRVREERFKYLHSILREPPRALHLNAWKVDFKPVLDRLLRTLGAACPRMEEVSLSIESYHEHSEGEDSDWVDSDSEEDSDEEDGDGEDSDEEDNFEVQAALLITAVRHNDAQSMCKSMTLRGENTFRLLSKAHPKAAIELSNGKFIYADKGDGICGIKVSLHRERLISLSSVNISKLFEVNIGQHIFKKLSNHAAYANVLSSVKLRYALVKDVRAAQYLGLTADTVEIPIFCLSSSSVGSLFGVRKVRFMYKDGRRRRFMLMPIRSSGFPGKFLQNLAQFLDSFQGEVVWMSKIPSIHVHLLKLEQHKIGLKEALGAVDRFEQRGGDVGTVRAVLDAINRRCQDDSTHITRSKSVYMLYNL